MHPAQVYISQSCELHFCIVSYRQIRLSESLLLCFFQKVFLNDQLASVHFDICYMCLQQLFLSYLTIIWPTLNMLHMHQERIFGEFIVLGFSTLWRIYCFGVFDIMVFKCKIILDQMISLRYLLKWGTS